MRVLVTGASGFIGKNLAVRLRESGDEVIPFNRSDAPANLRRLVAAADAVVHLAGENRPADVAAFEQVNVGLTRHLCDALANALRPIPVLFTSSTQAVMENPYGISKQRGEQEFVQLAKSGGSIAIYRLPGVFGKWCRPNYNSVVATLCHNIARDLPITVSDESQQLRLVYIDDVVDEFIRWIHAPASGVACRNVEPDYVLSLGELARAIRSFHAGRASLHVESVGTGLLRALYATYVSYLPPDSFAYDVPAHADARGVFVEMLKTPDAGQFSYFTARPGVTRGGHYHHSKSEKFLVLQGRARFGFRHIITGETVSLETSGDMPRVVDTIPGWAHDITNIGSEDLLVMLWANENFDRKRPDTVGSSVQT